MTPNWRCSSDYVTFTKTILNQRSEKVHFVAWYMFTSCPITLEKRGHGTACASRVRERNFRRHARRKRGKPSTGEPRGKAGGTELEIDPWCSRWDAILFIVLIISEYIVRTRHDAPRSRTREIYAIETTPSPPPVHHHHYSSRVCASCFRPSVSHQEETRHPAEASKCMCWHA